LDNFPIFLLCKPTYGFKQPICWGLRPSFFSFLLPSLVAVLPLSNPSSGYAKRIISSFFCSPSRGPSDPFTLRMPGSVNEISFSRYYPLSPSDCLALTLFSPPPPHQNHSPCEYARILFLSSLFFHSPYGSGLFSMTTFQNPLVPTCHLVVLALCSFSRLTGLPLFSESSQRVFSIKCPHKCDARSLPLRQVTSG